MAWSLRILESGFAVCKVADLSKVDLSAEFVFVAKTDEELSLVCATEHVPCDAIVAEHGWRALRIEGIIDFEEIGVIAGLAKIISGAGMSLFVISTYNTDYILLKEANFSRCIALLEREGYHIIEEEH